MNKKEIQETQKLGLELAEHISNQNYIDGVSPENLTRLVIHYLAAWATAQKEKNLEQQLLYILDILEENLDTYIGLGNDEDDVEELSVFIRRFFGDCNSYVLERKS